MKYIFFFLYYTNLLVANAESKMPSKDDLDLLMFNVVKQFNSQMPGSKIDEYTNFKFVTYDQNPPLFSYFYSVTEFDYTKQNSLNQAQIDVLRKINVNRTCQSQFKPIMKQYNLRVQHTFEDKKTGKLIYKLTVSHNDC